MDKGVKQKLIIHEITTENFVYNKSKNILNVEGNVKFVDKKINITIFSDEATYLKNGKLYLQMKAKVKTI